MNKAKYQKMYTEKHKQDMDFVIIGDNYIGPFIDMEVAQKAVSEINKQFSLQPKRTKESTAFETLERMGYEWKGGELWKPPLGKPKFEYEYVKVTDSIFDLRDEFERGKLYYKNDSGKHIRIEIEQCLVIELSHTNVYRRTEKQVDWRDEVLEFLCETSLLAGDDDIRNCIEISGLENEFFELCRVALRARGEL